MASNKQCKGNNQKRSWKTKNNHTCHSKSITPMTILFSNELICRFHFILYLCNLCLLVFPHCFEERCQNPRVGSGKKEQMSHASSTFKVYNDCFGERFCAFEHRGSLRLRKIFCIFCIVFHFSLDNHRLNLCCILVFPIMPKQNRRRASEESFPHVVHCLYPDCGYKTDIKSHANVDSSEFAIAKKRATHLRAAHKYNMHRFEELPSNVITALKSTTTTIASPSTSPPLNSKMLINPKLIHSQILIRPQMLIHPRVRLAMNLVNHLFMSNTGLKCILAPPNTQVECASSECLDHLLHKLKNDQHCGAQFSPSTRTIC
jgi:hypothetical protein